MKLSQDQQLALDALLSWFKDKNRAQFITLGGYAGTGKTTLISILRDKLHKEKKDLKVAYVSYTGKAARVLLNTLKEQKTLRPKDSVGTIHSLMYSPIENNRHEIIGWELRDEIKCDLVIVDEASMVDSMIWNDLLSFKKPVIAVGDHGQLPPIRGKFNLMEKPQLKLEEIHRQAKNNPIIQMSILARTKGEIPHGEYGDFAKKVVRTDPDSREFIENLLQCYNRDTLVLCGYNNTRIKLNRYIRSGLEIYSPTPITGDRVICLRNNRVSEIFNGMLGTITSIEKESDDWYFAKIEMDGEDELFSGDISVKQFDSPTPMNFGKKRASIMNGDLFDYGYALTVHKAQGSQSKRVVLFEERFKQMDDDMWRRWLYTAVTRAQEELYIIG